jgi:hypothetical protein
MSKPSLTLNTAKEITTPYGSLPLEIHDYIWELVNGHPPNVTFGKTESKLPLELYSEFKPTYIDALSKAAALRKYSLMFSTNSLVSNGLPKVYIEWEKDSIVVSLSCSSADMLVSLPVAN